MCCWKKSRLTPHRTAKCLDKMCCFWCCATLLTAIKSVKLSIHYGLFVFVAVFCTAAI